MPNTCRGKGGTGTEYTSKHFKKRAAILYPSLLTPAISVDRNSSNFVVLLASDEKIEPEDIKNQLRLYPNLESTKIYSNAYGRIQKHHIEKIDPVRNIGGIYKMWESKRFKGILSEEVHKNLKEEDLTKITGIKISSDALKGFKYDSDIKGYPRMFNLIWVHYNKCVLFETGGGDYGEEYNLNEIINKGGRIHKVKPKEVSDKILDNVLNRMNGENVSRWCVRIDETKDNGHLKKQLKNPIQTYHPVVLFGEDFSSANIGHIADIHLCGRQNTMGKNPARVIEYEESSPGRTDIEEKKSNSEDVHISPCVGTLVNNNLERLKELLFGDGDNNYEGMGEDENIDAVIIGGDIVDYIESLHKIGFEKKPTVKDVWDRVSLGEDYKDRYKDFVDMITFYTIILEFCRKYSKPVFIVSGNHDAFHEPYGISPRKPKVAEPIFGKRANASIPGDHNMTFYESILCFGDTYGESKNEIVGESVLSFKSEMLEWFYSVFTPFTDYAVRLPKQWLVGIEWGEGEDVVSEAGDAHADEWFHTPRALTPLTDAQRHLLETTTDTEDRRVILSTHFTFVSYSSEKTILSDLSKDGTINCEFGESYDPSPYDVGTFEENRDVPYDDLFVSQETPHLVLTGHTHRRGLYSVKKGETKHHDSLRTVTTSSYFPENKSPTSLSEPLILVSDSAGPLPVYNFAGELDAHGRDSPSGTRVLFDAEGHVVEIDVVKTSCQPRFPVVVDYIDIMSDNHTVIKDFSATSYNHSVNDYNLDFNLEIAFVVNIVARVSDLYIYALNTKEKWYRVELSNVENNTWTPDTPYDTFQLKKILNSSFIPKDNNSPSKYFSGRAFIAMSFEKKDDISGRLYESVSHYNFDSFWCFPVLLKKGWNNLKGIDGLYIERVLDHDKSSAEIPDFDWLKSELYK